MHLTSNVEPQKNLYEILGIDSNADDNAIKKAYRKKVLTCHPDKNPDNPNAAELFHEMTKAYSVLIDIEARKAYDEFLAKILENRPKSPQQYEYDFSKWSSADYESFKRHQYERQKSNYSTNNESKNNPNESNDEEDDPIPTNIPVKPKRRGRKYTPLEKFWYKLNFKRRLANEYDAEAANQHQSNRPISRKCQWTFLIVFLVQGLACCCLFPLL